MESSTPGAYTPVGDDKQLGDINKIAPEGDLVLIIGQEQQPIRVYSQCLRGTSAVFRTMFNPYHPYLYLPDDDAYAMYIICCVVHCRNDLVDLFKDRLEPEEIFQVAILADKYGLRIALKHMVPQWLVAKDVAIMSGVAYLMASAYIFRDEKAFSHHSLTLILGHESSYLNLLPGESLAHYVPTITFHCLEERRTQLRAEISEILLMRHNRHYQMTCTCNLAMHTRAGYQAILAEFPPNRMLKVSVSAILVRMGLYASQERHDPSCPYTLYNPCDKFSVRLDKLKKKAKLCFRCVEERNPSEPCQLSHEQRGI